VAPALLVGSGFGSQGKAEEALKDSRPHPGFPTQYLRSYCGSISVPFPRPPGAPSRDFPAHIAEGDTVIQMGSKDGSLLRELPAV